MLADTTWKVSGWPNLEFIQSGTSSFKTTNADFIELKDEKPDYRLHPLEITNIFVLYYTYILLEQLTELVIKHSKNNQKNNNQQLQ